jgi:endonuclease/exonuclease/phosphatase family metal-dependent hydrolase
MKADHVLDESRSIDDKWRKCFHYTLETGWNQFSRERSSPPNKKTGLTEVTITSYNLMSQPDAPKFPTRVAHIVEAISKSFLQAPFSLRVLCLQEVDEEMLPLLLGDPTLQELLPFSSHSPSSLLPSKRNLVTLSAHSFASHTIQFTERHKSALAISFYELPLQVANVHLTSALTDEAIAIKKRQMETLTTLFSDPDVSRGKTVLVAGDFNLTSSSKTIETALSQGIINTDAAQSVREVINTEVWEDVFVALEDRPKEWDGEETFEGEEGATFDRLTNPLASLSKVVVDNRPQRYDRVLFKRRTQIRPLHFEIFGQPNEDGTCWSDHYGICATLQIASIDDTNDVLKTTAGQNTGDKIKPVEDSTDLQPLINRYLPTDIDRKQREDALALLQQTLSQNKNVADLILAPLGSYCMETYFTDSDIDVLAIASVSLQVFFDFATEQLRALDTGEEGDDGGFKGVHFVNSLVSIIEVNVLGIKFDVQYCQAPELVKR